MLFRKRLAMVTMLAVVLMVAVAGCENGGSLGLNGGGRVHFVLSSGTTTTAAASPALDVDATGTMASSGAVSDDDHLDGDGDEHRPFFESATVTLSSVLARNLDGVLVDVAMELPATVDVMQLTGNQVTLPDGVLPPDTYDQLVIVMTALQGVTFNGTTITIEPPGGGWTAVVPVCPFEVVEGGDTTVQLRFMVGKAFSWRDGRYWFSPHFECGESTDGEG